MQLRDVLWNRDVRLQKREVLVLDSDLADVLDARKNGYLAVYVSGISGFNCKNLKTSK